MYFDIDARSLDVVLGAWSLGSAIALLLGAYRIKHMKLSGWASNVDWAWVVQGVKIAFALLMSTLAIRAIFTLDRYFVENALGLDVLGPTFYLWVSVPH